MQAFTKHKGTIATLLHNNIDTDQIIPKQFLSKVTREGFGQHLFHDWRYLDEAGDQPNPEFELNLPKHQGATILIAGDNFGCGSSREHAPWALADYGFRAVIAPSFADIFYSNSINIGMLPVRLSEEEIQQLLAGMDTSQPQQIEVDLENCQVIGADGKKFDFTLAEAARHNLLKGLDAIGLTLEHQAAIDAHAQSLPAWQGAPNPS
ncbi:3-isopropylmalate dehydratase small subunit [Paraferrimonas sedimenticola]|uniref:3-isopropylmalate dehydratase small subunit n=1 Tax=Paraferrimonas sedimenticola TaxID=375674 RepID=A0AA37W0D5_9GAMM|nr:3-isopropylmalate dehydratase small subunit [Paraferrimonas sedimenticola]GLP95263.1 3-isopropylmalate dehydratase small subunit [Paraferrimonas sedimenticola]